MLAWLVPGFGSRSQQLLVPPVVSLCLLSCVRSPRVDISSKECQAPMSSLGTKPSRHKWGELFAAWAGGQATKKIRRKKC